MHSFVISIVQNKIPESSYVLWASDVSISINPSLSWGEKKRQLLTCLQVQTKDQYVHMIYCIQSTYDHKLHRPWQVNKH